MAGSSDVLCTSSSWKQYYHDVIAADDRESPDAAALYMEILIKESPDFTRRIIMIDSKVL
jgi:hypothetical protein